MHAVFYLFGKKDIADRIIKWLETREYMLPFENPDMVPTGPKDAKGNLLRKGFMPIDPQLRYGFFGTWEYVFPENEKDRVLSALKFSKEFQGFTKEGWFDNAKVKARFKALQKLLGLEPIPEFNNVGNTLIPDPFMEHCRIIPIGVRYDRVAKIHKTGLVHEAI